MGNCLEQRLPGSSSEKREYIYADGVRLAVRINDALSTGNFYWFHLDHLGGTHLVTRDSGAVASTYLYDAWGGSYYEHGQGTVTDRLYTGQTRVEQGLYYYGARWYDPGLGRFLQADTILPVQQGTQGWDRYAYVNNNPVNGTDPTGTMLWDGGLENGSGNDATNEFVSGGLDQNYNIQGAIEVASRADYDAYNSPNMFGSCGPSQCTNFVSNVITTGGKWIPKVDPQEFVYGCPIGANGMVIRPQPFIYAPDFVSFMKKQPDVVVMEPIKMSEFSPELFQAGDIVAMIPQGTSEPAHMVFVDEATINQVHIIELSGSAQPPTYGRFFKDTETVYSQFIIIRINPTYP